MPITEVSHFYCPGAAIFGKGGSNLKGGAVNGGAVNFQGGAVTFQNMRSVQTNIARISQLNYNITLKFLYKMIMLETENLINSAKNTVMQTINSNFGE